MRHKQNRQKRSTQRANSTGVPKPNLAGPEPGRDRDHDHDHNNNDANPKDSRLPGSPPISPPVSRTSTPSTNTSKTSFVRAPLALTKLQQEHQPRHGKGKMNERGEVGEDEGEVEPYSPHYPHFTPTQSIRPHVHHTHHHHHHHHQLTHDPVVEPIDPEVIQRWEQDLQFRLQQAYPRMCYYFLCDKSLFLLVTLLTIRRLDQAEALRGWPLPGRREDRQYVNDIAQCMSHAEKLSNKDEEWMTWWRETLLMVQQGLQRGWIGTDSPITIYAKDIMKLYRRFSKITRHLAEAEAES